jgi:hypothetical protein
VLTAAAYCSGPVIALQSRRGLQFYLLSVLLDFHRYIFTVSN